MVSQLKATDRSADSAVIPTGIVRHPLLQTVEGTVQVFTAQHRNFFTHVMVQALHTADQGKAVLVVQFLKGGIQQGPDNPMHLGQNLDWIRCDLPHCMTGETVTPASRQAVGDLWQHTQRVVSQGCYSLVVLDELSLAVNYGLVPESEVVALIAERPPQIDVIMTGPAMPPALLNLADQVTELRRNFWA